MGQTLTAFDAILKEDYQGPIRDQLNSTTNLLDLFVKGDIGKYNFTGREVVIPLHSARNSGAKSSGEAEPLPKAGNQGYANMKIPLMYTYGHIQLTEQTIKASRNDAGAFARALEEEQKRMVDDISRLRNRQIGYFGQGTLGVISSGANSTSQAINNPGGVSGTINALRFLPKGAVVAFVSSDGTTLRGVRTISSVSDPNITVDSSVNTTTGDLVTLGTTIATATDATYSSYNREPMGLLGMADTTTYVTTFHNIDRSAAANAFFKSTVLTGVGALSPDILNRAIDNTEEVSGKLVNKLVCHQSVRREFAKLTEADRRYNVNSSDKGSNFDAGNNFNRQDPTHNGVTIKADKDFAYGTIVGLNTDVLEWIPETQGEWADDDGNILLRDTTTDQYEARYRVFENFTCFQGNALFRLDGVNATLSSGVFSL